MKLCEGQGLVCLHHREYWQGIIVYVTNHAAEATEGCAAVRDRLQADELRITQSCIVQPSAPEDMLLACCSS